MKFRFKLLCVTLCLALSAAAFTGCSGQGASSASGSAASASATGEETHEPGLFIDGQKVVLIGLFFFQLTVKLGVNLEEA